MSYDSDGCSLFETEICVGYGLACYTAARTLLGGGAASLLVETICVVSSPAIPPLWTASLNAIYTARKVHYEKS